MGAGFVTDNDFSVGETKLDLFSYDADLGELVAQGSANDFQIFFNGGLSEPLESGNLDYVPEPTTLALAGLGLCSILATRRRRLV